MTQKTEDYTEKFQKLVDLMDTMRGEVKLYTEKEGGVSDEFIKKLKKIFDESDFKREFLRSVLPPDIIQKLEDLPKKSKHSLTFIQAVMGGKQDKIEVKIESDFKPLRLSMYEERTLDGLIDFFSSENFPEDRDKKSKKLNVIQGWISKSHLYQLAGVKKVKRKDGAEIYPGRESQKIDAAMWSLDKKPYKILYTDYASGRIVETQQPLIEVAREYENKENYKKGDHLGWYVYLNDIVKANLKSFYRLLPPAKNIYLEIKEYTQKHASSLSTQKAYQFIKWLHKHGAKTNPVRINWLNLAKDLGMDSAIKKRRWARISETLKTLYEMAKALDFLESYKHKAYSRNTKDKTVDILNLNPEKFEHLKEESK
ncbi:MAG: hypothetical protein R6V40_01415 [Candidatus Moraniibacteriota bacterium]